MEAKNTADIEKTVLAYLNTHGEIQNTESYAVESGIGREDLEPVIKSLTAENYISLTVIDRKEIELTDEGRGYAENGSPEYQFVSKMVFEEVVDMAEMESRVGAKIAKVGFGKAMKEKWIAKEGEKFKRVAENPVD